MKKNIPILGFVIGAILPMLGVLVVYLLKFKGISFGDFISGFFSNGKIAAKIMILSLLVNLIPFVYYTNKRLDYTARGIFIATMIYVAFILLLMYVW